MLSGFQFCRLATRGECLFPNACCGGRPGRRQRRIVVAFASDPPAVYVSDLHGNLKPGWPALLPYQVFLNVTSPVVADLDRDSSLDVELSQPRKASSSSTPMARPSRLAIPLGRVPVNNPQWSALPWRTSTATGSSSGRGECLVSGLGCSRHQLRREGGARWPRSRLRCGPRPLSPISMETETARSSSGRRLRLGWDADVGLGA
jgi:hypothetical protein